MKDIIKQYADQPVSIIRAHLTIAGHSGKAVTEALKEAGISSARIGFVDAFYDWLGEESRDKAEVLLYVEGKGEFGETSENVVRHLRHYAKIGEMSRRIWEAK